MRPLLIAACLVGLSLGLPTTGRAQSAPDCGVICNITSYLAADHMAAEPSAGAPAGPAKTHRAHTASRKQAPPAPAKLATAEAARPTPAPKSKTTGTPRTAARAATGPVAAAVKVEAPHRAVAKVAKPAPARVAAARPAVTPRQDTPVHDTPVHARVAKASPGRPTRLSAASRAATGNPPPLGEQTALANIPGSAPTIQAGFQPFGSSSVH